MASQHGGCLSRARDLVQVVVFATLMLIPVLGSLRQDGPARSEGENRLLAPFPSFDGDLVYLPRQFDAYLRDHLTFRERFIQLHHQLKLAMRVSPRSDVLLGRDGWLMSDLDGSLADHRGESPLSSSRVRTLVAAFRARTAWLTERGVRHVLVIAPDKETIYPEYLPDRHAVFQAGTHLDQLLPALLEAGVPAIDLRNPLRDAKRLGLLYYPGDTHWADLAMHVAHRALVARLRAWFPSLPIPSLADYERGTAVHSGDLARYIHAEHLQWRVPTLSPRGGWRATTRPLELDPTYPWPSWGPDEKKHPKLLECPDRSLTVLALHDSFGGERFRMFSAESFGRIYSIWARLPLKSVQKLVETLKPDVVIELYVERMLGHPLPGGPDSTGKAASPR